MNLLSRIAVAIAAVSGGAAGFAPAPTFAQTGGGEIRRSAYAAAVGVGRPPASPAVASLLRRKPRRDQERPASLQRQRSSVASVQTMSLFGLGGPEIGVILIAAVILLGPETILGIVRDSGKVAGELKEEFKDVPEGMKEGLLGEEGIATGMLGEWKEVPKEFQKNFDEGQTDVKASKAKKMGKVPKETEGGEDISS